MSNTKSQDARIFYANTFGVAFTGTEMQLSFGVQLNPGSEDPTMEVQSTLMMSHQTAKFLSLMLNDLLSHFETSTGTVIPVDQARYERVKEMIGAGAVASRNEGEREAKTPAVPKSRGLRR